MNNQKINLFIVDDNKSMVSAIKVHIQNSFGDGIRISTFYDGESCLKKVDNNTTIVILDYLMKGNNGLAILGSIKALNPKTEVIMLSGNDDIIQAIQSLKNGATDYIVKGANSWRKITSLVNNIITEYMMLTIKELQDAKFLRHLWQPGNYS